MDEGSRLISAAEVARLAGVTRAAISNWRRRHADFPEPVGGGRNALFVLSDITDWLDRQRKSSDVSDEVLVWQDMRALYGDDLVGGVADMAAFFQGADDNRFDETVRLRLRGLAEQSSPARVVEAFTDRVVAAGGALTTRRLAEVVRRCAGDVRGTVFDPACGAGSLLLAFAGDAGLTLAGQELNPSAARLTVSRGHLAGASVEVRVDDSLQADRWGDLRAELVVCDPPVGLTDWGRDSLLIDKRWEFGVPTKAESELAWLQHCYAHTAPGGRVVMVMSPSVAYRRPGKRIRAEMLRAGVVEQIVALPPGLAATHGQSVHLWVLRRPLGDAAPTVRMTEVTGLAGEPERPADVPVIDLLDEAVDLTPAAHMPVSQTALAEEYAAARESLAAQLRHVADVLPALSAGRGELEGGTLRMADLARAGLVDLDDGTATSVSDQLDTDFLRGFLRSAANVSRSTSSSGTYRIDVRGSRIPQLGIDDQRAYGTAFRALDDAEATLRELTRRGLDAIAQARDGLTSGALRPGDES